MVWCNGLPLLSRIAPDRFPAIQLLCLFNTPGPHSHPIQAFGFVPLKGRVATKSEGAYEPDETSDTKQDHAALFQATGFVSLPDFVICLNSRMLMPVMAPKTWSE